MKTKHTPGPWGWYKGFLCTDKGLNSKMIMKEAPEFFNEEDSRLIGAAPELLEAAQIACDELKNFPKDKEAVGIAMKNLTRAIAKATGGDE